MSKTKEVKLDLGLTFPLDQHNYIKPFAGITEIAEGDETDEELFRNAYKKLWEMLEGHLALTMARIMQIRNDIGLLGYARELGEDIGVKNNRYADFYLKMLKLKDNK